MNEQTLKISEAGQKIIDSYLKMAIGGKPIICPYYINLKKQRAALRVFLGKGLAQEIINEANFISLKEEIDLNKLSEKDLYQFLVKHNLGIDCSGLTTYILQAIFKENKNINIFKKIKIVSFLKNPYRWLITQLRPIENISVRVLANDKNSFQVNDFQKIKPGDMLIRPNLRHVYLITKIKKENNQIKKIIYINAPRPKQKDYFGPGIVQNIILLEKSELKELRKKMDEEIIIRRLKF